MSTGASLLSGCCGATASDGGQHADPSALRGDTHFSKNLNAAHLLEDEMEIELQMSSRKGVNVAFLNHFLKHHATEDMKTAQLKDEFVMPRTLEKRTLLVDVLDPKYTGKATVFVSHAYSYKVVDCFGVMLRYEQAYPNTYFWFDPFSLNQHGEGGVVDTEDVEIALSEQIKSIGATLIVSSPWNGPIFLERAWCLFELLISVNLNVPITTLLPFAEHEAFLKSVAGNFRVVYEALAKIDSRKSQAREQRDLDAINEKVSRTATHAGLNKIANTQMRKWLVTTALDHEKNLFKTGGEALWSFQSELCVMLLDLGELDEAERVGRQSIKGLENEFGERHPSTLTSVGNLARALKARGKLTEAEPLYQRALLGFEDALGSSHADTLCAVNNLGELFYAQGKMNETEVLFQRALEGRTTTLDPLHRDVLLSVTNMALLLEAQGKLDKAEPLYRRALLGREQSLGALHPGTLNAAENLARILQAQGNLDAAEPLFRRSLSGKEETLGPVHANTLRSIHNVALFLQAKGDVAEAKTLCRRALAGFEKTLGPLHPQTLKAASSLRSLLMHSKE